MPEPAGVVLGSVDATPLEFWIGVGAGQRLELDDLVMVETTLPPASTPAGGASDGIPSLGHAAAASGASGGIHSRRERGGSRGDDAVPPGSMTIRFYGIVDVVRKRYEGAVFDSDAFRAVAGTLPVDVSYAAHVQVTRVDPEIFVPPHPGDAAHVVRGADFQRALYFDRMERKLAVGLTRAGEPIYANLEFLDGTRGAHVSISGVSGVATKTSYATFLLYSLFHSTALGPDAVNSRAIVFNVKGEDLLWLDRPNTRLSESARAQYARLGLAPGAFQSVAFFAPARRASAVPIPDTGSRQDGVRPYLWTLFEFARDRLLRFAFAEGDDPRAQLSFVIEKVEAALAFAAGQAGPAAPALAVDLDALSAGRAQGRQTLRSFSDLLDLLDGPFLDALFPASIASGTLDAFRRRLHAAAHRIGHLVRGDDAAAGRGIDWTAQQVTVVDIHKLHSSAQMFVVGVLLKRMLDQKEAQGLSRPLVFVVLDELNKYAPREGWSPIREVLLDIAERGRSLGVSLFGAQQTASEVERRVLANASLKVVGRLDAAEAERSEYGFLTKVARLRATLVQPGSMIVAQPEIPTPVLLGFPFPAWATRESEAEPPAGDPFERMRG